MTLTNPDEGARADEARALSRERTNMSMKHPGEWGLKRKMPYTLEDLAVHHGIPLRWCYRCDDEARGFGALQRAHVVAHAAGGSDEPWNVVPLCRICHAQCPAFVPEDEAGAWAWFDVNPVLFAWETHRHLAQIEEPIELVMLVAGVRAGWSIPFNSPDALDMRTTLAGQLADRWLKLGWVGAYPVAQLMHCWKAGTVRSLYDLGPHSRVCLVRGCKRGGFHRPTGLPCSEYRVIPLEAL